MTMLDDLLAQHGSMEMTNSLAHAERTVQDIVDEMTPEQRDLMDLIVGAAVEDEDISDDDTVRQYLALSDEQQAAISFIVGGLLRDDSILSHADEETLAHFGVKGMRWGVRNTDPSALSNSSKNTKEGRSAARAKVKAGSATLGDAHLAGLKSTGHRVANAFLGDKTYWKQTAYIAGGTVAAVGATFATAGLLPASVLGAIGAPFVGSSVGGVAMVGGHLTTTAAIGQQVIIGLGLTATQIGNTVAGTTTLVTNTGRALRGNARINKSYAALGAKLKSDQAAGNKRVQKILNQSGSLRKKNITHDDLEHSGVKGMQWGVRNDEDGSITLAKHGELTTDGRSFIKKALGDKTYWQRAGIITAVGLAGVASAAIAPGLLPVALVASAGGPAALATGITAVSLSAMRIANMVNYVDYIRNRSGFVKHADLQNSELSVQEAYDSMTSKQKTATAILIAAAVKNVDVSDDEGLAQAWQSMSDEQRAAAYFLGIVATTPESEIAQSDLEHAAVRDETTTGDGTKGGKGNFDESKVKRDGHGQFSKKAALGNEMTDQEKDKLWKENLFGLKLEMALEAKPIFNKAAKDIVEKYGASVKEVKKDDKWFDKHPEAKAELLDSYVSTLENIAKQTGVSPSGTKRLAWSVSKKGMPFSHVIDYSGPMPARSRPEPLSKVNVQATMKKILKSDPSLAKSTSGGFRFNPKAKLDTSRITDASDTDGLSEVDIADSSLADEVEEWKELLHSDDEVSAKDILTGLVEMYSHNVLEHHGIKGMKWGVRRENPGGGGGFLARRRARKEAKDMVDAEIDGKTTRVSGGAGKMMAKMKPGESVVFHEGEDGKPTGAGKLLIKQKDGSFKEVGHVSVDAERVAKTSLKESHEMSDREIKEAVNRANTIEQYNKIFTPNPNKELQAKVDALRLEKEYRGLQAELKGKSNLSKMFGVAKRMSPTWAQLQQMDQMTGGLASATLKDMGASIRVAAASGGTKATKATPSTPAGGAPTGRSRRTWGTSARGTGTTTSSGASNAAKATPYNPNYVPPGVSKPAPVYNVTNVGSSGSSRTWQSASNTSVPKNNAIDWAAKDAAWSKSKEIERWGN